MGAAGEVVTMKKISTSLDRMLSTGNIVVVQTAEMRAQGVISVQLGDQQITLSQQDVAAILPELKVFVWRRP